MNEVHDLHDHSEQHAAVQAAADELAGRLRGLADDLAGRHRLKRVHYGRGRIGNALRRRSPEGFVLDPVNLEMLLPDGRLWSYARSDSYRFPAGRFYDASTDYRAYGGGRSFPGGTEFIFLGAVIGKYTFGYADRPYQDPGRHHSESGSPENGGLWAIVSEGRGVRYVGPDEAFADITHTFHTRGPEVN